MVAYLESTAVRIHFQHVKWDDGSRSTRCNLMQGERLLAMGIAHYSVLDNFCKERGRKLSLTRAVKRAHLSKDDRAKVWYAYLHRS